MSVLTPRPSQTLCDLFRERARVTPDERAYRQFDGHAWVDFTWAQAAHAAARFQAALTAENLKPGDRVGVCLRNRFEWVLFDQAALSLGLVVVPLFYNDRPDNIGFCLNDAGAHLVLLESGDTWSAIRDAVPSVTRAVCLSQAPAGDARARGLEEWLSPHAAGELRAGCAQPEGLASIVYTSGTTGRPKGVMLSHRNIVADLTALIEAVPELRVPGQRLLSFLPLSHMFERTVGYYIPICLNAEVVFARGIQELGEDLLSQRPSLLVSVPRIFERVYAKIDAALAPGSFKRRLFEKTVDVGWRRFKREATLGDHLIWPLLDHLVAAKLRARLGGRVRYVMLGGAALAPHLLKIFTGVGLIFIHGYGLTETSPVLSCNRLRNNDPLSVGEPLPGIEVRVADNGELHVRGAIVTQGYWNNPEGTHAAIDADGWFHTGDVVERREGRIYIRGRVKDIVVLSNGEKIPPGDVEQAILQDGVFEQVMVVGEGRPALTLLAVTALTDLNEILARANAQLHAFPGYTKIRYVLRLNEPFSIDNGLLTPTLKLKRGEIERRYAAAIEALYRGRTEPPVAATAGA